MRTALNIIIRSMAVTPSTLPGLAAWYSADYGVLTSVGGGTAFASASSQYLSCASNATLQTGNVDFSYAFWIRATNGNVSICGKGAGEPSLSLTSTMAISLARQNETQITSTATVGIGSWAFVVVWHSGGVGYIQINDGIVFSSALSFSVTTNIAFYLGAGIGAFAPLNGNLDEAAFFKRVLTAVERTWLYNSGAGRTYAEADAAMKTNLVSWWSMNAPASGNWLDQHSSNHLSPSASRPTATDGVTFRAAGEGETVRRWLDRSGNGRYLEQTTFARQPVLSGGYVLGDGNDDSVGFSWSVVPPYNVWIVRRSATYGSSRTVACFGISDQYSFGHGSAVSQVHLYGAPTYVGTLNRRAPNTSWGVDYYRIDGASSIYQSDAGVVQSAPIGSATTSRFVLLGRDTGSTCANDYIAEVVLTAGPMPSEQILRKMGQYFSRRHPVTLA